MKALCARNIAKGFLLFKVSLGFISSQDKDCQGVRVYDCLRMSTGCNLLPKRSISSRYGFQYPLRILRAWSFDKWEE
jgi:hypothetical protein